MRRPGCEDPSVLPQAVIDRPVWDKDSWAGLAPLDGDAAADLCVVGLGGSGLAAVDEGLRLGKSVVGVDAGAVAGEAAGRNGGFLLAGMSVSYNEARDRWGRETAQKVYRMSLDELDRILTQPASRRTGSLRIADSDAELDDISLELAALREDGFEAEPYDGPEGPGMHLAYDGVCNPMQRARDLVPGLVEKDAALYENTRVTSIEPNRVITELGAIEAERIVVAVDGRIELLLPELKGRVRTARLEMLSTEPMAIRYTKANYTAYGYIYWQQLPDGRLAIGGLRDRFAEHSWSVQPGPTDEVQSALDGYLDDLGIEAAVECRWAGHAAYTEDRAPIYEEIRAGAFVVGGYCGHGNVLGSVYGRAAVRSAFAGAKEPLL